MKSSEGWLIGMVALLVCSHLRAQEHSVGSESLKDGFRLALPGYSYSFPRDHAAHPEFRTEWWYFTGHLAENDGSHRESRPLSPQSSRHAEDLGGARAGLSPSFGYELTFFRNAIQSKPKTHDSAWSLRDVYFAHFAISDLRSQKFWFAEQISRGALGVAGAETNQVHAWINDWSLKDNKDGSWQLDASRDGHSIALKLTPVKHEVIHGEQGVSQKSAGLGHATHYVSFTRMKTEGQLSLPGQNLSVTGESWFDHEFGTNQLTEDQVGWDWFSFQFTSGEELMIYLLRKTSGCYELESSGTWVAADGKCFHLGIDAISVLATASWKSPQTGATYPARWEIRIPKRGVNVLVEPLLADQELVTTKTANTAYWEGACRISGSHRGRAYVELTGYTRPVNK